MIAATVVVGFVAGYWIGHGEMTTVRKTAEAMLWLPVVWLGRPVVLLAYVSTALAWYLPIRFERGWARTAALAALNAVIWTAVIGHEVRQCLHGKFWQW